MPTTRSALWMYCTLAAMPPSWCRAGGTRPVEGVELAFSRSVSGRARDYACSGTTHDGSIDTCGYLNLCWQKGGDVY